MTRVIEPGLHHVLGEVSPDQYLLIGEVMRRKNGWQAYTYHHHHRGSEWQRGPTGNERLTIKGIWGTGGHRYLKDAAAAVADLRAVMIENKVY